MKQYLFSYGTLQPGLAPAGIAPIVARFRLVGRGWIRGVLYDLGHYPGAVLCRKESKIWGQTFELPEDPGVLRKLDEYEEFDSDNPERSQFVRKESVVFLEDAGKLKVWVYVYNRDPASAARIADGDFKKFRNGRGL